MKIIMIIFLMFMGGCGCDKPALTNQEIIKITNECREAGLTSREFRNGIANSHIYKIQCGVRYTEKDNKSHNSF